MVSSATSHSLYTKKDIRLHLWVFLHRTSIRDAHPLVFFEQKKSIQYCLSLLCNPHGWRESSFSFNMVTNMLRHRSKQASKQAKPFELFGSLQRPATSLIKRSQSWLVLWQLQRLLPFHVRVLHCSCSSTICLLLVKRSVPWTRDFLQLTWPIFLLSMCLNWRFRNGFKIGERKSKSRYLTSKIRSVYRLKSTLQHSHPLHK